MSIIVRQARIQDYPAIGAFIHEAYGPLAAYKGDARWRWQFLENPATASLADEVPVWVALDGTRVVGQIAVERTRVYAGTHEYEAGWIVDVIILPSHRDRGLGHLLYSAVADSHLVLLTLTMAPATRRMAERLGAITLPQMHQWSRWANPTSSDVARYLTARTRHRPLLARGAAKAASVGGLATTAALSAKTIATICDVFLPISHDPSYVFRQVDRFDEQVNNVWESLADAFGLVPRTAEHLNWRFVDCPQLHYERFQVEQQGRVTAYLVLRQSNPRELRQGFIVDAMAVDDNHELWRSLFAFGIRRFGRDVCSVETAASTPVPSKVLAKLGFLRTRRLTPTIVCRNPQVLAELSRVPTWFFNKGDHDWDQIHLA